MSQYGSGPGWPSDPYQGQGPWAPPPGQPQYPPQYPPAYPPQYRPPYQPVYQPVYVPIYQSGWTSVAPKGPGFLAVLASLFGFAVLELLGSVVMTRIMLPGFMNGSGASSLTGIRDGIAMLTYGMTAAAAALAATPWAWSSRKRRRGFFSCFVMTMVGVFLTVILGVITAELSSQVVVFNSIATHFLVAMVAVLITTLCFKFIPRRSSSIRTAAVVAVVAVLVLQGIAPAGHAAAASYAPTGGDIAPGDCGVETIGGSINASLSVPLPSPPMILSGSVEGEVDFDFAATKHPADEDGNSWVLSASAGLKVGPSMDISVPGPVDAGVTLSSKAGVKAENQWAFPSQEAMVRAVTVSMANFAWDNMAFVGLSVPPVLAPDKDVVASAGLPSPTSTTLEFLGSVDVSLHGGFEIAGVGPSLGGSIGGEGSVSVTIDKPSPNPLDIRDGQNLTVGFSITPSVGASAGVDVGFGLAKVSAGASAMASGTLETYLTVNRTGSSYRATALGVGAAGDLSASVSVGADIGTEVIGASMQAEAGVGTTGSISSRLTDFSKPEVSTALLTILRYAMSTGHSLGISLNTFVAPPTQSELVDAAVTLIRNSTVQAFAYKSVAADASVELRLIAALSVGAGASDTVLVSAWYGQGGLVVRRSAACVAPAESVVPMP